jgi:hypothetical protein
VQIESFAELGVDEWEFCATLDASTSKQCAAYDGQHFPLREGPLPPLHPSCRSKPVPYFGDGTDNEGERASADGPVSGATKFRDWIEDQGEDVQNKVFGSTVATAWRAGRLTIDQMLGRDLQPLTLAELRKEGLLG